MDVPAVRPLIDIVPGRTPYEAVEAFLDPLRTAINVLSDYSKILVTQRGGYAKNHDYSWVLCGPDGMQLSGLGRFSAEMRFRVIDADQEKHEAPLRVTTRGYRYKLQRDDKPGESWLIHWHPTGESPYKEPHIHIPDDLNRHLPTGRITFEKVIAWCIEYGAPTREDKQTALDKLAVCEAPHLLHRSWSDSPKQAEA